MRVFKKITRNVRPNRRLHWADDDGDGGRWLRLRRRIDETEELPAILDEQRVERGSSSFLSASADGGGIAGLTPVSLSGAAAPSGPEAKTARRR
jgi:hypothetical protein